MLPLSKYQRAIQRYGKDYFATKQREWRERNPRAWVRWNEKNPERRLEINRGYHNRHKEIRSEQTVEYYRAVVYPALQIHREEVLGRPKPINCELCEKPGRISFDHCHQTGKARGWLCSKCNTALGMANDDPMLLRKLADYLESHRP